MLTNREVLRRLRKLQQELAVIPRINYGGCGVMAAIAGEALQKLGIQCEVITPGSGWREGRTAAEARNYVNNVADPREWDKNGLDRGHLALRFRLGRRTYTWDSDAMYRGSMRFGKLYSDGAAAYVSAGKWGTGLTVEECKAMSSKRDGWNSDFKRKHIPAMRRITKTVLLH